MHRVVNPPGEQARSERYSFAYCLKPRNDAGMERLRGGNGGVIPELAEGEVDPGAGCKYAEFNTKKTAGIVQGKNDVKARNGDIAKEAADMQVLPKEITA